MSKLSDYADLGFLPLQDHQSDSRIVLSRRKMVVAGRIVKEHDPSLESTPSGHWTEIGKEDNKGTLGDLHPWLFWQTRNREKRGMGAWQSVFAGITEGASAAGGGPTTGNDNGPSYVLPVRNGEWQADQRFKSKSATSYARGMQMIPRGVMSVVLPATEERQQFELIGNIDPRLFAPNASGPGDCGTIIADLQPDWQPCMDSASRPGIGGRQAKLQSLVRVIAMPPYGGSTSNLFESAHNLLAINYTSSDQDRVPGFGAIFGKVVNQAGPTTGGGQQFLGLAGSSGQDVGKGPNEWGSFAALNQPQFGVALMDALEAGGVIHLGSSGDKHRIGNDRDGHPINSAHLAVTANWFRDSDNDGPMLFEGDYPNPAPLPLTSRVHLSWDGGIMHSWRGSLRRGMWRWWAEVPYLIPPPITGQPPYVPTPPGPPPTGGGGPRPGGPGPGGPGTPGGPGGPGAPRPPGGGAPGRTGGPGGPSGGAPGSGGSGGGGSRPITGPTEPSGPAPGVVDGYPGAPYPLPGNPITPGGGGGGGGSPNPNLPPPANGAPGGANPAGLPFGPPKTGPRRVGGNDNKNAGRGDKKSNILNPFSTGFSGVNFRPQKWIRGAIDWLNSQLQDVVGGDVIEDEPKRPNVLNGTPWGAQSEDCWNYTETPATSSFRGGTASGGLLFHPPSSTMDDYLGLGASNFNAYSPATQSYVTLAPGVALSFGQPHKDGGIAANGIRLRQLSSSAAPQLQIEGTDSSRNVYSIATMGSDPATGEVVSQFYGNAVRLMRDDGSLRPATPTGGELRIYDDTVMDAPEWWDTYSSRWVRPAAASSPYTETGLAVLGAASGVANAPWGEIPCVTSGGVLRESGGALSFAKLTKANLTFGVQASEAGNPVRTICASSTAEATLTTLTIPANTISAAGDHCILEFWGDIINNSGGSIGLTLRVKVAGVTVYQQAASIATAANRRALHGRLVLAYRAANAQRMSGVVQFSQATAATVGVGDWSDSTTSRGGAIYGDATATTSSSAAFLVSMQSDTSNANIGVRIYGATLSYVPA